LQIANDWNEGKIKVLAGHPAAMAHGLNLQACGHHIVWYSLTWNYEYYDQFIRRVYRQGQTQRVFVYRILARKTVDDSVLKALNAKERGQSALFAALKQLKRGRK
jgi:SNF2 family DNA or RNA helicase